MKKRGFEIYVYHRIGRENSLDGLTVSKQVFSGQMKFLKRRRRPMTLGELVSLMSNKRPIPSGAVAVTFDDGYRDTFELALPILKKFKIPATVFITTGYIDGLVQCYKKAPMMSWAMVKKLQKAGIEIGAHSLTHPNLKTCSLKKVRREMDSSKKKLEERLRTKVRFFAYPYGGPRAISKKIQACARRCGFSAACTTLPGRNSENTDIYALRRTAPIPDEIEDLVLRLEKSMKKKSNGGIRGITKKNRSLWARHYKEMRKWL